MGGAGLVGFIGLFAETLPRGLQVYLSTAICVICGHAALSATVLLHGSRRRLRAMRDAGVRLHLLERGHALAAATLLLGVVVPGLFVLAHLLLTRDVPLIYPCLVLAFSNHPMRYAFVLLPTAPPSLP